MTAIRPFDYTQKLNCIVSEVGTAMLGMTVRLWHAADLRVFACTLVRMDSSVAATYVRVGSGEGCAACSGALGCQLCCAEHETLDGHLLWTIPQHYFCSNLQNKSPLKNMSEKHSQIHVYLETKTCNDPLAPP